MRPADFIQILNSQTIDFFAGVPDSLLAALCAELSSSIPDDMHVIAANEGAAIALASGYHLATGRLGCVYMQNSGQGNSVNPLVSLADSDVYSIPMLLVIGWRGEPGIPDEPQHRKQGKITQALQDTLGIPTETLCKDTDDNTAREILLKQIGLARSHSCPVAIIVSKGFFQKGQSLSYQTSYKISREWVINQLIQQSGDIPIVSTTGKISRELYEAREQNGQDHSHDFLTVGSMGHAISIAMGVAIGSNRRVICLDGDGAVLMHMGSMAVAASRAELDLKHIVLNNAAHESVGGQPTVAGKISLSEIAGSAGYNVIEPVEKPEQLPAAIKELLSEKGLSFLEVRVALGSRPDLGRPATTPQENKEAFMAHLKARPPIK